MILAWLPAGSPILLQLLFRLWFNERRATVNCLLLLVHPSHFVNRTYVLTGVLCVRSDRLKPFTSYQFRVKATNDIGDSEYSEQSEAITTLQDGNVTLTKTQARCHLFSNKFRTRFEQYLKKCPTKKFSTNFGNISNKFRKKC